MTNEQLTAYLQDESYIYTLSYEELKTLVVQYPYASNLRVLLLKKSYVEQNKDYDRNLQMASTYTTNRKHLYKLIKNLKQLERVPQNVILGEDYLELASLSDIGKLKGERDWVELKEDSPVGAGFSSDMSFDFEPEVNIDLGSSISDINVEEESILDLSKQSEVFDNQLITKEEFIESEKYSQKNTQNTVERSEIPNTFGKGVITSDESVLDLSNDVKKNEHVVDTPIVLDPEWDSLVGEIVHDYTHPTTETPIEKVALIQQEESIKEEVIDLSNIDNLISLTENPSWNKSFFDSNNRILNFDEPEITDNFSSNIIDEIEKNEPILEDLEEPILSIFFKKFKENKEEYSAVETPIETPQIIENEPVETVLPTEIAPVFIAEKEVEKVIEIETKPAVELEIVNEQKAKIIEATTPNTDAPKVSFTDWLRQFKAASSVVEAKTQTNIDTPKPTENPTETVIKKTAHIITTEESQTNDFVAQQTESIDNQSVTNDENMRVISNDHLAEMFETPQNAPENLFGLQEKEAVKPVEIEAKTPSINIEHLNDAKTSDTLSDVVFDIENRASKLENTEGPSSPDDDYTLTVSLDTYDEDEDDDAPFSQEEKEKKKKKKKKKMHDLAARSLQQDDEIVSEMLANILALQGHKKQAKAMYEKLCLQFPEKRGYFAAKIEKLRNS